MTSNFLTTALLKCKDLNETVQIRGHILMVLMRNKKNYHQILLLILSFAVVLDEICVQDIKV